jgi:hypothetical protein
MKRLCLVLCAVCLAVGQIRRPPTPPTLPRTPDGDVRLPNGKSQREETLKEDYKKNLEDVAELVKLAEDLKAELEKDDRYVVSVKSLKDTNDIERLAKTIRGRLKRF